MYTETVGVFTELVGVNTDYLLLDGPEMPERYPEADPVTELVDSSPADGVSCG